MKPTKPTGRISDDEEPAKPKESFPPPRPSEGDAEPAIAAALVAQVKAIAQAAAKWRESALAHGKDGTMLAGCLARELLAAGAGLPDPSPHALRWAVDEPTAIGVVRYILSALAMPKAEKGAKVTYERMADIWPKCETKAAAAKAWAERLAAEGQVIQDKQQADHAERLAAIAAKGPVKASPRPAAPKAHPGARDRAEQAGEGEWVEGDRFEPPVG